MLSPRATVIRVRKQEPVYTHTSFTKSLYNKKTSDDRQALVFIHEPLQHLGAVVYASSNDAMLIDTPAQTSKSFFSSITNSPSLPLNLSAALRFLLSSFSLSSRICLISVDFSRILCP